MASQAPKGKASKRFKTKAEAIRAYHNNEIDIDTRIDILEAPKSADKRAPGDDILNHGGLRR
jgi:hypothetical protein